MNIVDVDHLDTADLLVDAIYQGGRVRNAGADPLPRLIGVSTGGGFRYRGSIQSLEMVALTSSKRDPDWPDELDRETGIYTYYGDNKVPGAELHGTQRFGNQILRRVFEDAHSGSEGRLKVPPILAFESSGEWRDVIFLGLAVPGVSGSSLSEDLVVLWRTRENKRFQNYRARFTILRAESIPRSWLSSIIERKPNHKLAPRVWLDWVESGRITPLLAPRTIQHRRRKEQLPSSPADMETIRIIHDFFADNPYGFERCAAELTRMLLPNVAALDLTRRSRDGGRDGIGQYRIGSGPGAVLVDFALEAKCYSPGAAVGVREVSRLISRLRHRQFGILVTTSCVDEQAYKEIKDDGHPIVIVAAIDIVNLLREKGYSTQNEIRMWLASNFPPGM